MGTQKFNSDIDVSGEVKGTSLDVNGAADISGNTQLSGTLTVGVDDTGHDVQFFGATSGKYLLWDEASDSLLLRDDVRLKIGSNTDMQFYHQSSVDTNILELSKKLHIIQQQNDGDIQFSCDDGSGGIATYLTLDGSLVRTEAAKDILFLDGVAARFGNSGDLQIYHDGTYNVIKATSGHMLIKQDSDDQDIIFQCDNGSGGTTAYLTLDGSVGHIEAAKDILFLDGKAARFGDGGNLSIQHSSAGETDIINNTGDLTFTQNTDDGKIIFKTDDGSGGTETYISINGTHEHTRFTKNTRHGDSVKALFGSGEDLEIHHDASNSYISQGGNGNLYIQQNTNDADLVLQCDDGSNGTTAYLTLDGSAGYTTAQKQIRFADSVEAQFGGIADLTISHDATNSVIANNTGDLQIKNRADDKDIIFETDDGSGGTTAYLTLDGSAGTVEIAKSTNISGTVTVTGSITAGAHDGSDKLYVNRFNGTYPYGHVQAGSADENVKVGIKLDTRRADGVAENALAIEGDTRAATFAGSVTATSLDINGAADISGNTQLGGTLTVGANDAGHDVILYGNTADKRVAWDTSVDHLKLYDDTKIVFGTGAAEADYDGSIYWDQTDLVIDSESDLQILSNAIVTGSVTATSLDVNGAADISEALVLNADSTVGWHGSVTRVKILPRDFQPDSGGRPAMTFSATNEAHLASNGSGKMFASIPIPTGFKATHVKIHGSDTGQTFTVYEANIANKTTSTKGTATAIETEKAITNVSSTTTNYILIEVSSDGTADEVHGGYMTIAKI